MKYLILYFLILSSSYSYSQSKKVIDKSRQLEKEDPNDMYKYDQVTTLDLIEALELASIRIHKFKIGAPDKEYQFQIFADEYINGKLIKTDTLFEGKNDYTYGINKDKKPNIGFIDQIKIFTKTDENNSTLNIKTYSFSIKKEINLGRTDHRQFYNWSQYIDVKWKLNKKIPLLNFASSWLDKEYDVHRFCGAVNLNENDKETIDLLSHSPNYAIISYKISE